MRRASSSESTSEPSERLLELDIGVDGIGIGEGEEGTEQETDFDHSLPSVAAWRNHCLSLSDPSSAASICCYLLDFDPAAIGREILVLAWNYLPSVRQHEAGVLEAVRWCLAEAPGLVPGPSFLTAIPLDCVDAEPALATRGRVFGVVRSVSVVFTVPRPSDDPPPRSLPGWTVRGNCQTPLGDLDANFLRGSSNRLLRGRDLWAIWVAAHAGICDGVPRGDLWFKPGGSVEFCAGKMDKVC